MFITSAESPHFVGNDKSYNIKTRLLRIKNPTRNTKKEKENLLSAFPERSGYI